MEEDKSILNAIIMFIFLMLILFVSITLSVALIKFCIELWSNYILGGII